MSHPPRSTALLAVAALLVPLAAAGLPVCNPAGPCPMATAMEMSAPCHGSAIQADDCCPADAAAQPVAAAPLTTAAVPAAIEIASARWEPLDGALAPDDGESAATPLYTLFRTLLI